MNLFRAGHGDRLPTVRIQKIVLENFKSVKHGEITMHCGKKFIPAGTQADILGIYGQNGSGKTSVIEALAMLKYAMSGARIPEVYASCISEQAESSKLEFTFDLQYPSENRQRKVVYSFGIKAVPNEEAEDDGSPFDVFIPKKGVAIVEEKLQMSGDFFGTRTKLQDIIDTKSRDVSVPFTPLAKRKYFTGEETPETLMELALNKRICEKECRSFVFSKKTRAIFYEAHQDESHPLPDYLEVLTELYWFAAHYLFVVDGKLVSTGKTPYLLPLYNSDVRAKRFDAIGSMLFDDEESRSDLASYNKAMKEMGAPSLLPTESPFSLSKSDYDSFRRQFESINVVISQLVPGMGVKLKELSPTILPNGEEGSIVQMVSIRDGVEIPFGHESEGIQKIVGFLDYLIHAYNQQSTTVAIDEFDSGVFEFLLGELLEVLQEGGRGQFIFTSHNLRPLEVLDKKYICFTTTNPHDRYARLKSVGKTNNLRNLYFREITIGEQDDEFYRYTQRYKIARSLRGAGGING